MANPESTETPPAQTEATAAPSATSAKVPALLEPDEYSRYMLHAPAEVALVLRGLAEHMSQITVFFNEGKDMLITTLAEVSHEGLILDYGPSSEINRKALEAEKHFCVASLDKVRIQFILRAFRKVEYQGRPSFSCALPEEALRLQRREFYRLTTPIMHPLICTMPIPLADGSVHIHDAHIFDISGGGVNVLAPDEQIPFATDQELGNCRIELPEVGFVVAKLRVKSLTDFTLKSGTQTRRAGCEFIDLPGPMMTLIQRYIIKVERERKARESGLG